MNSRGKNVPTNKIYDDSNVILHIKYFPAYQSHYSRKDSAQRRYLDFKLNIGKMYSLYVQKCSKKATLPVKIFGLVFLNTFMVLIATLCTYLYKTITKIMSKAHLHLDSSEVLQTVPSLQQLVWFLYLQLWLIKWRRRSYHPAGTYQQNIFFVLKWYCHLF